MSTNSTLIEKYPLKRRKVLKKTIQKMNSFFVLFILFLFFFSYWLFIIFQSIWLFIAAFFFLALLLFILIYIYETFYFKNYFYDITEEGLIIKKGVFSTKKSIIPLNKIQDVYLDQDIFDKIFGLWDLHISSATETSGFEAHIDGVNEINAREMRNLLLGKTLHIKKEIVAEKYFPKRAGLILMALGGLRSALGAIISIWILCLFFPSLITFLIILSIPILLVSLILNSLEFNSIRYELRNDGVFIKRGFLAQKESLVLYRNIQDVEETQNFIEMLLGIKTLSVKTMTGQSAVYSKLQYLSQDIAPVIREKILNLSQKISKEEISFEKEKEKFAMKQVTDLGSVGASPYKNHFIKSAIYSYIIYFGSILCLVEFILISFVIFIEPSLFSFTLLPLAIFVFLFLLMLIDAAILSFTYSYTLLPSSIIIKYGLFNVIKKQINYDKIQDLVIGRSFSQYLAKLASLKVDTGSREITQSEYGERSGGFTSMSTLAESIPDLEFFAAANLRKRILDSMGVSVKGLCEERTLVSQFPLEEVKPVKKTLWWVIYFTALSILAFFVIAYAKFSLKLFFFVLLLFLVAIIVKYTYEREYYKRYFYNMNEDALIIRKGVFGITEIIIPFSKIQDIFIDQDILDRLFNLRDLYVSTVTARSILNAHIDGISPEKAEKIALLLLEKIKNKRKQKTT